MYVLKGGKRRSISADAHTTRFCKDRRGDNTSTNTHTHTQLTEQAEQKGRKRTAGNELSYLLLSAAVVYSMNKTRVWREAVTEFTSLQDTSSTLT